MGQKVFPFLASVTPEGATRARRTAQEFLDAKGGDPQVPLVFHDRETGRRFLEVRLRERLREQVQVTLTDNRRTMISSRRSTASLQLRLHHMFADADDDTVDALARFVTRTDRRAGRVLDEFIEENAHRIRKGRRQTLRLRTRGEHHDLADIFEELNQRWFGGKVAEVRVTWGRRPPSRGRRRRRTIRLGTYVAEDRLIRIHPALDQEWVPRFFVAYVVFHEILHHVVPAPIQNGRQCFHGPEFRKRERAYPDYARAMQWERANLRRLLRS